MENLEEFQIPKEALERMKDPEVITQLVEEGKTFQEIIGYTDETMDKFYRGARGLFEQQKYREAADAFIFLTTLNPYVHNYWLGLGMSEHLEEEYHGALLAYGMAMLSDSKNPLPHYHSAACYQALDDKTSMLVSLDLAINLAGNNQEYTHVKTQAESAKERTQRN